MTPQISFPYRSTYWIVIAAWWAAMIVVVGLAWAIQPQPLLGLSMLDVMAISLASGAVSTMAIMPGFAIGVPDSIESDQSELAEADPATPEIEPEAVADVDLEIPETSGSEPDDQTGPEEAVDRGDLSRKFAFERLGNAFFVGMTIRLVGTVALFLVSSYYLEASPETTISLQLAAWILSWHLYLLLVEVIALTFKIQT
ncbi:hypothetical protein SAMN06265222_11473 [Neorhodopirellula lusitana]|uniref:Uncharacterized protein n=1 Tax=Neorhodopirellula lusitana TaxID=445327 RepID=A0ABY1QKU7_9BACT|nr:hypothetical protein [Neorhodopirellula lusitana]SMP71559.1 hypothetical protein SAMN06265222_11473 [Neorhodopirellula lusitana]